MDADPHALTHTFTVRLSPRMREDLAAAAEREDISTGELARRSFQIGLSDSDARSMSPREALPVAERQAILAQAITLCGDEDGRNEFICLLVSEILSLVDGANALLEAVATDDPELSPDLLAARLRSCDLHLQRSAAGINGLRARRLLDVIEAETVAEAA